MPTSIYLFQFYMLKAESIVIVFDVLIKMSCQVMNDLKLKAPVEDFVKETQSICYLLLTIV